MSDLVHISPNEHLPFPEPFSEHRTQGPCYSPVYRGEVEEAPLTPSESEKNQTLYQDPPPLELEQEAPDSLIGGEVKVGTRA